MPAWPFQLCDLTSEFQVQVAKGQPLVGSKATAAQLGRSTTTSQRQLPAFLPLCTDLEHHAAHPLTARAFDHPGHCPCLKHWSNTGAVLQTGSRVLGEVVTLLPSQHASVPSLPHLWHSDTSTHTVKGPSQKSVMRFVCIIHGLI